MLVLALGVGVGLVNGLIITKLRVNAFIATLGTALIIQGIIQNQLGRPRRRASRASFRDLGYTRFGVIPMSFFLLVDRRGRDLVPAAQHALRLPHLRGRRLRGRLQALGPAHAPHDHRRARRVLADAR